MALSPRIEIHELYAREFQVIMADRHIQYLAEPLGASGKAVVTIVGTEAEIEYAHRIMSGLRLIIVTRWVRTSLAFDMMLAATQHGLRVVSTHHFLKFTRIDLEGDVSAALSFA
jgi:hypothetical protein